MERYCFNAFNRLVSDVNELFDLLANQDPSLETKLDDLDLRINMLINFCRDTLPQSALNDLRGMRELVDSIRGALGFETQESGSFTLPRPDWDAAGRFLNGIWEMLQKFAPFFGGGPGNRREFGAP